MGKKSTPELNDEQKELLYNEAKKLAAIGSISALERAVSLLSKMPKWKDSDKIATLCLQKIMVLRARSREKNKQILKNYVIPAAALLIFGFLMFKFVFPDIRYASSLSGQSVGDDSGFGSFERSGGFSAGGDGSEESENGDGGEKKNGEKIAMPNGEFDTGEYDKNADSTGRRSADPPYDDNDLTGVEHREESIYVTGGEGINANVDGSGNASGTGGDSLSANGKDPEKVLDHAENSEKVSSSESAENGDQLSTGGKTMSTGGDEEKQESSSYDAGDSKIRSGSGSEKSADGAHEIKTEKGSEHDEKVGRDGMIFTVGILLSGVLIYFLIKKIAIPASQYRRAMREIRSGNYPGAIQIFNALNGFRDSSQKITYCENAIKDSDYSYAIRMVDNGRLEEAINAFDKLGDYKDSAEQIDNCMQAIKDADYSSAVELYETGKYEEAIEAFKALDGYKKSHAMISDCKIAIEREPVYQEALSLLESGKNKEAEKAFLSLHGFKDSNEQIEKIRNTAYEKAIALKNAGSFSEAISAFDALKDYKDCVYQIQSCKKTIAEQKFTMASELKEKGRYEDAIDIFSTLSSIPEAKQQIEDCKKLLKVPRPFDRLYPGQSIEEIINLYGPSNDDPVTAADKHREFSFSDIAFLDSVGTLSVTLENGVLKNASWNADFFWKTQNEKNRGKGAEKQYKKFVAYYTSLFGPRASEYSSNGHTGSWWKQPVITIDRSANDCIAIHCFE